MAKAVLSASDWEKMEAPVLLRRLLLHRDDIDSICAGDSSGELRRTSEISRTNAAELLGRAVIWRSLVPGGSRKEPLNQASRYGRIVSAHEQMEMTGLLLGRPDRASRMMARPVAFDCPDGLSNWATLQADLIPSLIDDLIVLAHYAGLSACWVATPGSALVAARLES